MLWKEKCNRWIYTCDANKEKDWKRLKMWINQSFKNEPKVFKTHKEQIKENCMEFINKVIEAQKPVRATNNFSYFFVHMHLVDQKHKWPNIIFKNTCRMERQRIRTPLSSMGLRVEASLAKHILQENCWESNLVADISNVDYLEDHWGITNLFHWTTYRCSKAEMVHVWGRKVSCEPVTKQIVARISMAVQEILGEPRRNTTITNTVLAKVKDSKSVEAIAKIEHGRARENWKKLFPEEKVCPYFVAKIDLSQAGIGKQQKSLPALCRLLESRGDEILPNRPRARPLRSARKKKAGRASARKWVRMQNSGKYSEKSCILDNTNRVGGHVCTWRHEVDGHRARTKVYNKVVSQWFSQGA